MSHIVIKRAVIIPRQIRSKDRTQTYTFNEQPAALFIDGEDFPRPFNVPLADGQAPYPPGNYAVDLSGFDVSQYGNLELKRRYSLVPVVVRSEVKV